MDSLTHYRQAIKQLLTEHAEQPSTSDTVRPQLIFDEERDHYQLNYIGWQGHKRVFGPIMHFDIENGKIWVQYNGTEDAVAQRLVEMGVPQKKCWAFILLLSASIRRMRWSKVALLDSCG